MKRWAVVTILLYVAMLAALVVPLALAAFFRSKWIWRPDEAYEVARDVLDWWVPWGIIVALGVVQAALMVVPLKVASRRPVSRRALFWPVFAGTIAVVVLMAAATVSAYEVLDGVPPGWPHSWDWDPGLVALIAVACLWGLWTVLFWRYAWRRSQSPMGRMVRFLLAGSILELLIAVPAHVYCRCRDHCCGGFLTVWGLAAGIAVMLLAFGPAVFALFVRRVQQHGFPVQPGRRADKAQAPAAGSGGARSEMMAKR